jgi:Ala-tRNA(Pro) deacylase
MFEEVGAMTVVEKVIKKLEDAGVPFKKMEHPPVITSEDAARVRKTDLQSGAKALVFMADGSPVMLVLPGGARVDTKNFKKTYSIKDFRMATEAELMDHTGLEKGAVPPLGSVFGIKTYYDESFHHLETVAFNVGSRSVSVEMSAESLIFVEKPILGKFVKDAG